MVADELRRRADNFIELEDLRSQIGRDPIARAVGTRNGETPDNGEQMAQSKSSAA